MKNLFIICVLSLLVTDKSYGQDQFYLGLKTGIGFSFEQFYTNGTQNKFPFQVLKYNFNGGIALNIGLSKTFSLQSEMIFEDKGYRGVDKEHGVNQNITRAYLQFPELVRYTLNIKGENKIKPFIELGIYFASHLYTSNVVHGGGYSYNLDPIDEAFNKFDWGVTGGIGAVKKMGRGYGSFNARIDNSVINALANPTITIYDTQTGNDVTITNKFFFRVFSFTLSYTYPLKREKK